LGFVILWLVAYALLELLPSKPLTYHVVGAVYGACFATMIFMVLRAATLSWLGPLAGTTASGVQSREGLAQFVTWVGALDVRSAIRWAAVVGLIWGWWSAPLRCSPEDIIADPSAYDRRRVEVIGTVGGITPRISRIGNEYTLMNVCDQAACIRVFAWGLQRDVEAKQSVDVRGTYETVHRVSRYTFFNEIEASAIGRPPLLRQLLISWFGR